MLIFDKVKIGNKLYKYRKMRGLTQAEAAERSELSDKAYADIERGNVNMRTETLLHICDALNITPDEIFIEKEPDITTEDILTKLSVCTQKEKETALKLLSVYIDSL